MVDFTKFERVVRAVFDFGNANDEQRKAISTSDGPVLITAGPGTGKTYTLVQRAIYLIQECNVAPESIMMVTFTEKAAKELITRITNELAKRNISVNMNEMYIGTFHSICLRILKEHLEYTRLKKNYRVLDQFDQNYVIFQNIYRFRNIDDFETFYGDSGAWRQSLTICEYVNNLTEELIVPEDLISDSDLEISVLGKVFAVYKEILDENNLMDFSSIQTEAYRLLIENPKILGEIQEKISYIMVDEYQDTNYIQEQIVFLLAGEKQNICVVGDDDQGLYRFRGATIRNILEFPQKFDDGKCKIVQLVVNYRSNSDIVDFYNEWMQTTGGARFKFQWDKFRYDKKIVPNEKTDLKSSAVVKLYGENEEDEWHKNILSFIIALKESGKLTDYNQIAFLFNSVKNDKTIRLARFLEGNGINVYSPRSDMFFEREEIRIALGCMMLMFPKYVQDLDNQEFKFLRNNHYSYYRGCIITANSYVTKPENRDLLKFIRAKGKSHLAMKENADYAYSGLLYQLFEFEPFKSILDTEMDVGIVDVRPACNLAMLSRIIGKYEYLHRVNVLNKVRIDSDTEKLFNLYFRLLYDGGISEYEDDSEYAPSGCVSFLTIHQSKGMEFPIVLVGSLQNIPRKRNNILMDEIEEKYFKREAFEPKEYTKFFDFWRLYYTAFSRAQNLLVLTCNTNKRCPSKYFKDMWENLQSVDSKDFDIAEFDFVEIKGVNIKNAFSFTSHISVYETCSLQYKFYKELEFAPVRAAAMLFGTLVHQTIEDVHKAALRGEVDTITEENVTGWFDANYVSLSKTEHSYLGEGQKNAALQQVLKYVERQDGEWDKIQAAEVDVSLVQADYIIEGKVDLVKGEGDTYELVDFKSEKKPDVFAEADKLERYRRQLNVYAYLIEERTGKKVSKMHLYYTGEDDGLPTITYPNSRTSIEGTMLAFDDIVHKIMNKEYKTTCNSAKICDSCDFRFYCKNR